MAELVQQATGFNNGYIATSEAYPALVKSTKLSDLEFTDGSTILWQPYLDIPTQLKGTNMKINTGLNWIGTCGNIDCSKYDIRVISNRGLGKFEI